MTDRQQFRKHFCGFVALEVVRNHTWERVIGLENLEPGVAPRWPARHTTWIGLLNSRFNLMITSIENVSTDHTHVIFSSAIVKGL